MLTASNCSIYQVAAVLAQNNGIQRPPVFSFKNPASPKLLLLTNRVFYSSNPSVQNFFRRWVEPDQFAAFVVNPYAIPKPFGQDLAGIVGQCGKQIMNLVHFSQAALLNYQQRKKPVVVSGIVAKSMFMSANLMLGLRAPLAASRSLALLKGGAVWKGSMLALDAIADVTALPWVVSELANLENHINQHPKNSPQRKAIQTALFLSVFGDWASISQVGAVSVKHWKTTAKVLGVLAVGGTAGMAAIREKHVAELVQSLREGNVPAVRSRLCTMQMEAGLRKNCSSNSRPVNACK
jgi:hypothetical protein